MLANVLAGAAQFCKNRETAFAKLATTHVLSASRVNCAPISSSVLRILDFAAQILRSFSSNSPAESFVGWKCRTLCSWPIKWPGNAVCDGKNVVVKSRSLKIRL